MMMIKKVSDIAQKNLIKIDILKSIRRIQDIFQKEDVECLVVYEGEKPAGVITKNDLIGVHPNRIAADVMTDKYIYVGFDTWIWEIKEIFDLKDSVNIILVEKEENVIGYITKTILDIEVSKHIDPLTGLYKSNYIFYKTYDFIKHEKYTTIIFIDLNNFGYIDKKYGHVVGDIILQNIASILKNNLKEKTFLCRYAGDEFVIVTPYYISDSKLFAEKIIKNIKEYTFLKNISVSASIGISTYSSYNNKTDDIYALVSKLINVASLASTKAKQEANNLIVIKNLNLNADEIA